MWPQHSVSVVAALESLLGSREVGEEEREHHYVMAALIQLKIVMRDGSIGEGGCVGGVCLWLVWDGNR